VKATRRPKGRRVSLVEIELERRRRERVGLKWWQNNRPPTPPPVVPPPPEDYQI
jgi:hypothetical protein